MTITSELLRRIHRLEFYTRRRVNQMFSGAYHSVFKGRGMEFESVRAYEPGDDVRLIDWNVTARVGSPFVKCYIEERELTIILIVDLSRSAFWGTFGRTKHDVAVELSAVLAYTAARNNDRVGLVLFSDHVEHALPPRKGRNHVLRVIRDLLEMKPSGSATNLGAALRATRLLLKHRSIVFALSDFWVDLDSINLELAHLAQRHDVIAIPLRDDRETTWPDAGALVRLRDSETGKLSWADTRSELWRSQFEKQSKYEWESLLTILRRADVDVVPISTHEDAIAKLDAFFQRRMRFKQ